MFDDGKRLTYISGPFALLLALAAVSSPNGVAERPSPAILAPFVRTGSKMQAEDHPLHLELVPSGFAAHLLPAGTSMPLPRITDAVSASDGSLYILDGGRGVVLGFDHQGTIQQTLGGRGRGDGQVLYPEALATDRVSGIYVLDLGNQRVVVYRRRPSGFVASAVSVPEASSGLCVVDSSIITFGAAGDSLLRVMDLSGHVHSRIGTPYSRSRLEESSLASGFLLCPAGGNKVAVLPSALPEIRVYTLGTGQLLWRARLRQYRPQVIVQSGDQVTFTAPPTGFSQARGIQLIPPDILVVQVGFRRPPTARDDATEQLSTYYYRLSDGRYLGQQTGLSRLLAVSDTIAFFADSRDSIAIHGFRYRVAGGPR
jgi:hypothetical protein